MVNGSGHIPERVPAPHHTTPPRPATQKPEFKPAASVDAAVQHDRVTISPHARTVSSIVSAARSEAEARPGRVAEARAKVGKGGNSAGQNAKIAEKLLTEQ